MPAIVHIWSIVFEGIFSLLFGIFGLIGNTIATFILCRPCFNDVFHRLLATLSIFDCLFIGRNL